MITASGAITPFNIVPGQLYSAAVQEAMDQYTGLSAKDLAFINTYITVSGSNYPLTDEFFPFILGSNVEANGSIGLKGTVGTLNGATDPTFDIGGILFDASSTQYFDTTIILSTDLTKASLNNIDIQCFVTDNLDTGTNKDVFGVLGTSSQRTHLRQSSNIVYRVNSASLGSSSVSSVFQDETLYGLHRDDSANQELFVNGLEVNTGAIVASGLPDFSMYVGANNTVGSAANFINAKISSLKISAAIGFNQALDNTAVRAALTAYGTI